MIILLVSACSVGIVTLFMPIYGLGLFALSLLTHGMLVSLLGSSATHLPVCWGIVVTIALLLKGRLTNRLSGKLGALLAMAMVMSFSALLSDNHDRSLVILIAYAKGFFLCVLIALAVSSERDSKILAGFMLFGVFVGAMVTVMQYVTGAFTISVGDVQRAASLRGDPNDTAMLLSSGIPLACYWLVNASNRAVRIMNMCILVCILTGMILTKSRGGFITMVCIMGILFYINRSVKTTIIGAVFVLWMVVFGAMIGYWDRVETLKTGEEAGRSLEYRLDFIRVGSLLFFENICIGVGPGQFGAHYMKTRYGLYVSRGPSAHNMFLEFAVENGILGIILLLSVIYFSLHGFFSLAQTKANIGKSGIGTYLSISLISLLINGFFLSQGKNSVLWFVVGLGIAAGQISVSHPRTIRANIPEIVVSKTRTT